jgi:hypothetical protein
VKNALASVGSGIDDNTEAAFSDPPVACELRGDFENVADHRSVARLDIEDSAHVLARNNQDMDRRSRADVLKGDHRIVLVNDLSFDFTFSDPAEKAVGHGFLLSAT